FLDRNQPPMFITLYFIVTRLPDSLRSVRDHFLSLDPTSLTVDLLEQHLLDTETSAVAVGAARGTPCPPFFEGTVAARASVVGVVEVAEGVAAGVVVGAAVGVVAAVGLVEGVGVLVARWRQRWEWRQWRQWDWWRWDWRSACWLWRWPASAAAVSQRDPVSLATSIGIFDLDFDAILSTMYALSVSAEGDGYRCVPPDLGKAAAALGASESGTLPGTVPAQALHTFTLDSGASACFFRDTTLTPLSALVPIRVADPSWGPVVACSSIVLPCPRRVSICTCTRTGRHLATFTRRPGSSLYTLATEPSRVAASAQVSVSGQVAASCCCRLLSHQTLLWHHRLCHPSLPRLRGMHSRLLVFGLLRSLPPLLPSPAPPCLPCVEGRQRAAPHSSSFPPMTAPHMDVWGPACVNGQGRERYFLLVVDDYTRYTTALPLRSKGQDLPVLCLHSARGGEFSSNLLRDLCRREGILQSFTLLDSPQQNGIAERRMGSVMEPRVSLPETSPTLCWMEKVGDASVFRVWGSRAFVRDTSADKLSTRAIPCVFLCFFPDAPGWQFYHPASRRVFPSQDVTFDESVPFYHLFPYRSAPPPPPPLFHAPGPPPVDPLMPQGLAPSGVSQVHPLPGTAHAQVAVSSGAAPGAASGGAEPRGAESEGAGSEGAEPGGEDRGSAEPVGVETWGVEPGGAESEGVESGGAEPRATGAGGTGDAGARGAGVTTVAGGTGGTVATNPGGARTRGCGAAGTGGVGGARVGDPKEPGVAGAVGTSAGGVGAGGDGQVLGVPSSTGLTPPLLCPPPDQSQLPLQPASPLPAPSPYTEQSSGLTERREPASHISFESLTASALIAELLDFAAPYRLDYATALVAESESASPPSVGGECALSTDILEERQEDFECLAAAVPRFASMLLAPEGDPDAPNIPTPRSYAEAITSPYSSKWQAAMDAEMASWKSIVTYVGEVPPPGVNIVDDMWIFRVKRPPGSPPAFKARYVARGFSQRQGVDYFQTFSPTPKMTTLRVLLHVAAQRDYELHSLDFSTAFLQGSLHKEIWLRRPPGFSGSFPARTQWSLRQPVYGLRQAPREWHETLRTILAALGFAPSIADPSLFLRTDTSLPPFYVLVHVDDLVFATADTEALTLVNLEVSFSTLASSSPRQSPLLCLPATRSQLHLQTSPTSGMGLVLGGRGAVVLTGHADASWGDDSATQRSSQGYTFSLGSGSVSWRSTRSSSVLSSSCEAEIYAGAMAAQELRWLTYLLTDLGEQPRLPCT
ncbi:unnamed protein product, partial [Closterium sp. NIES-53]